MPPFLNSSDLTLTCSTAPTNGKLFNAQLLLSFLEGAALGKEILLNRARLKPVWHYFCRKTTVILYKMLGIHRAWEQSSGLPKPRQVFVTKSRGLRANVEENFNNVLESLALAGCTREELDERRARCAGIRNPPINRITPLESHSGTPQKFSELSDHDFPLFITFDRVCVDAHSWLSPR